MGMNWSLLPSPAKKSIYDSKEITSEMLKVRDEEAKAKQSKDPFWKKAARSLFDKGFDVLSGFAGFPQNETKASQLGELVNAGLPFAAFGPKGIKSIYHGTQRAWDKVDYSRLDRNDVLGHMFHGAENPEYSGRYAMGHTKGIKHITENPKDDPFSPAAFPKYYDEKKDNYISINPRVIPFKPEAKNVLDLVDPSIDDLSQAIASLSRQSRAQKIWYFKDDRRTKRAIPEFNNLRHSGYKDSNAGYATKRLAEDLNLTPEEFESSQFDAIRYHDQDEKSWAIPEKTPIRSIYGAPLNEAAEGRISNIRMVRDDAVSSDMFPTLSGFGRDKDPITGNDYLDWAKSSHKPEYKTMSIGQLMDEYKKTKTIYSK